MTNPALERAARACARAFYEGEALDEPIFFETYGGRSVDELVEEFWPEFVPETRAVLMAVRDWALEHWNDDDQIHNQNYMLAVADCMNRISSMEDSHDAK